MLPQSLYRRCMYHIEILKSFTSAAARWSKACLVNYVTEDDDVNDARDAGSVQRISQNHQVRVKSMEMFKVIAALEQKGVFTCIAPMPEKAN
ncbi:hypothetical protein WN943_001508 [Citrus x changshan-huyou]